ncbi:MAG: pentapeptide repeat-containing protein [Leptolyngbya sp. Prado105]|nr:pentapeptide repeat-containing protein [Leptolyngbya sp. Prado105]
MTRTNLTLTALLSLGVVLPVQAENIDHVRQLLSTKQCANCELTSAGLVMAQLAGANLTGANLAGANLSQANLAGADLTGANLAGASLSGANLSGAKLTNANIQGADLTRSYLVGADLTGTQIEMAAIQGAVGLPTSAGSADLFYQMAMEAGKKRQYETAIANFNQALVRKPDFAPAFAKIP